MDFKSLLSQLDQLNEATEKTKTGVKHTAEPGGYGRKDDEDDEGKKVKSDAPKKGRGRPKKDADSSTGEEKKYDFSAFGVKKGKDVKLPKYDKKKTTVVKGKSQSHAANKVDDGTDPGEEPKTKKKGLKEYFDSLDKALLEAEQVTIQPAQSNTQVIKQGTKTLGTVTNPQLAAQVKAAIGKGEMSLAGDQLGEEDIGKHNNATTGFDALVRKLTPKYGVEAAKRIAGSQLKKIKEADMPTHDSSASPLTFEGKKKPDANKNGIPDYAEDGKGKNDLKKKKVDEGIAHKLSAARHKGHSDAMMGHSHCGKTYEDMEEARMYHEGYKEGLDECYGQMPIQGYVGEAEPEVKTMASYGAHTPSLDEEELDEVGRGEWLKQQASKPGDTFKAFGQTFHDKDVLEGDEFFESLDKQLNALLESKEEVAEGLTVSISKGQQGAPDSVSVNAQDGEADQLLQFIKQAGLGIFGGEEQPGQSSPMSLQPADAGEETAEIGVVGDHDGMMDLIKKVTGGAVGPQGGEISADHEEGHEHTDEEACNECGMAYESCGCDHGDKEMVDEVESEDQETEEVAEDNPPDSGEAEEATEIADTAQANAAGAAYNPSQDLDEGGDGSEASSTGNTGVEIADTAEEAESELDESYANEVDDTFESDIDFMTKVISGGLNKQKATGQTTIPVVATQLNRMHSHDTSDVNESVSDWKKLAGIK